MLRKQDSTSKLEEEIHLVQAKMQEEQQSLELKLEKALQVTQPFY